MIICDYCVQPITQDNANISATGSIATAITKSIPGIMNFDYHPECQTVVLGIIQATKGDRPKGK